MSRKVTTIFVLSFVAVLTIVMTVLSLVSYRIFFDFTSEEISETRLTLLNENTDKLSGVTNDITEAGYYIAANQTVIEIFSEPVIDSYNAITEQRALREQLHIMAGMKPAIYSLEIYTDRYVGYPMLRDGSLRTIDELESEPWFPMFDLMDSGWVPWENNGRHMVSFLHRLVDHRGSRVGYVKVNVLEENFYADLNVIDQVGPAQELLLILDSGDRVLARTPAAETEALIEKLAYKDEHTPYYQLRKEYQGRYGYHDILTNKNDRYLLLFSEPNHNRWRLVHLIPIEPLYAGTRKLALIVLLLGVLALLLSVPLVYWLGKRLILRPIRSIIQGMKQVERGNFNARINPLYVEEFDHMANHFNHMTKELDSSIQQIDREHRARRDAEMKMLQTQIMPHFLYNTLDIIHWKALDYQAEEISLMVNSLSKMFRIGLSGGRNFIRLRDELEHVSCYIDIQRARMSDREVDLALKVPAQLKDCFVPKIILQPFIENSMKHGYANKQEAVLRIRVEVQQEEESGDLLIFIDDEGAGLPEDWSLEKSTGIGMKNVQERIWMYCGITYGFQASNRPDGGTRILIRLPELRTQQEVDEILEKSSEPFDRTFDRK